MATSVPIRVLILGGGFGGLAAYLGIHRRLHGDSAVTVTLVADRDVFEFTPMLHEVATGGLLPSSIQLPLRGIPQCCLERFVEGTIRSVDLDQRVATVDVPAAGNQIELPYDFLVSALGSTTNFFGTPGAEAYALTLKDLSNARAIKTRILSQFERAVHLTTDEERERALRFVIVGGGPTGVELAGELSDLIRHELSRVYPGLVSHARVVLLQSADRLVPQMDAWFDHQSRSILGRTAVVDVRLRTRVREVRPDGVQLDGEFIHAATVVWTAGVAARPLELRANKPVERDERMGRLKVDEYLRLPSYPNVFIVGDQAWVYDREERQPYPMRAQFAIREGAIAAENIVRTIAGELPRAFEWRNRGFLLSLGQGGALGIAFGVRWSGPFAWWLYRTAYLTQIIGIRAKLRTALEWTLNLFSPRDLAKL
ncbi:NAD(P)/FAD-dependent oxidoreductase [Candidatus Uhrbacteria bacterium]|nr:NAD(P)/FAD-dependent oxidoreductase [Candidatus Uhrbacteria bacterium]